MLHSSTRTCKTEHASAELLHTTDPRIGNTFMEEFMRNHRVADHKYALVLQRHLFRWGSRASSDMMVSSNHCAGSDKALCLDMKARGIG